MRDEFNCRIFDCTFRKGEFNFGTDIFNEPLNATEFQLLKWRIWMWFVTCGIVMSIGFFPLVISLLEGKPIDVYEFFVMVGLMLAMLFIGPILMGNAVAKVLRVGGFHFDGLVLWKTSAVFSLLRTATGSQRVKLADAMQSNPYIGEKIGRFVRLIKEQGREPTALEALFCCARAELYKVEEGVKKADSIIDGTALEQKWGSR